MIKRVLLLVLVAAIGAISPASAESAKIRIARQWGLAWMPFVLMERNHIIERRAAAAGLGTVSVEWRTFSGGNVMNDALLSDNLDYATTGIPGFLVLWDKAKTVLPVRAVSGFGAIPFALVTRNPAVKTLKDFSVADRIALPTVKISGQAVLLQMAAAKAFGLSDYAKLDPLTVSLSNPDGMAALLSGKSEIDSHFSSPPYLQIELKAPAVHVVLTTRDLFETPFSNGLFYTTQKFHDTNPKTYRVVLDSLKEAIDLINTDRRAAIVQYLEVTHEPVSADEVAAALADPLVEYSLVPHNVFAIAEFMHQAGTLKSQPESWKELFFPEAHDLPGS